MSTVISIPKMAIRAFLGLLLTCCFLSGIIGDVPDGVVYTDLHKTVQLGDRVVLKCEFLGTPLAVYWKKGNDPTIKQSLMSWFGDEPLAGTCVKDKTCDMGNDFSLIIKNISIADQNRYICRVANYKGILIYNFTDVKVFALPEEPYPIIKECKENQGQNCILLATNPVNITCTVLKYFPNVDLFFLHGNQKYRTINTLEWTNTDGTKSKSVFTRAPTSEKPFVCVAFNIPGSQELQRTATVTVTGQSDITATPQTDGLIERNKYSVIKIVVPIIVVFCVATGLILFFTIYRKRQRRREDKNEDELDEVMPMVPRKKIDGTNDGEAMPMIPIKKIDDKTCKNVDEHDDAMLMDPRKQIDDKTCKNDDEHDEAMLMDPRKQIDDKTCKNDDEHDDAMLMDPRKKIDGKISYYELWRLVRDLSYDTALLRDTLRELRKVDIKEDLSEEEGYEILCTWKDNNRSGNEGKILNKVLMKVLKDDYDRAVDKFCANRQDSSTKSYYHALEHILWNIYDLQKIDKFLSELIPGRSTKVVHDSVKMVDGMQSAVRELIEWSNEEFELNPLVSLSFALERAGYRSVAMTFFLQKFDLPEQLLSPVEPKGIKEIVQKLTGRHCKRLMAGMISDDNLGSIIAENNDFLFDTKTMISDWLRNLECDDYEKRCRFDDAVIKIGRYDLLDCFGTISHRPFTAHLKEQLKSQQKLCDHETIYDDDIPQLVKLIKCLSPNKIAKFNKKTGFSADRDGSVLEEDLRERRDNILKRNTSRDASSREFKSLRHYLTKHTENFNSTVTDEEIEDVALQVTADDNQQELLRCLGIEVGAEQKLSFADRLKEWRKTQANRRKDVQDSLRNVGFGECIVSKSTKKFVYQVELSSIALNLLMEDVRPIIEALGIDRRTVSSYIQPVSKQNKGTKRLVLELLRLCETNRDDFCKTLRCIGFVDVSRSVYFDYEPSLSELINIVDCVGQGYVHDIDRFLEHLDLSPDDIEECRDSEGQINKLKLMRVWKIQIRPVPYHYRLEIATALRDARFDEIANVVLSGKHREKLPNSDVIKDIYSRLDDVMRNKVCNWLEEKCGLKQKASTALVKWANIWMSEYRPTGILSRLSDHMKDRKGINDSLFNGGIHELAQEISALENSYLP